MNKLIIDKEEFVLDNFVGDIEIKVNNLVLTVIGNVVINELLLDNQHLNLKINLSDNSNLEYNRFGNIKNTNNKIIINQNNNSTINYFEAFISNDNNTLDITNNIKGDKNISNIVTRVISGFGKTDIIANLVVDKDTHENELKEDLRGLETESSKITIIPNMLVDSDDVSANHFVTIGNVSRDDLFYLMSKGINECDAKKLLRTGFLLSIFKDENIKELIKEL